MAPGNDNVRTAYVEEWQNIDQKALDNLIPNMPVRVKASDFGVKL